MLTKDMLKFRRNGERIKPVFVAVEDPALLELAGELLEVYRVSGEREALRSEIEDEIEPLLKSWKDARIANGFNKLIQDRCEFAVPELKDYAGLRTRVLERSAELLKQQSVAEPEALARMVAESDPELAAFMEQGIYADLPENEILTKFRDLFPRQLLERYNCGQVQALLLYSSKLDLKVSEPEAAKLRKMFKYLKFFRLLAKIESVPGEPDSLKITIDGPASLFDNTRKYGLQLAMFFPAICDLEQWRLKAEIKLQNRTYRLSLDQKSGLVSHYRNFSAYVPEEVAMFHRLFKQKSEDWTVTGETPFFKPKGREVIFPDLSFHHVDGADIHLELFHRWHSGQLFQRLEHFAENPELPLIIGVDRALYNKPEIKERLDANEFFSESGFLFRDFPGVDRVCGALDKKRGKLGL